MRAKISESTVNYSETRTQSKTVTIILVLKKKYIYYGLRVHYDIFMMWLEQYFCT
jgi:hypothetical protein